MKATYATGLKGLTVVMCLVLLTYSACKKPKVEPKETEADRVTNLLKGGAWVMQTVKVDDVVMADLYKNLTITFTSTGYTSLNGGVIWPASGTWTFVDANTATAIKREDGLQIGLDAITTNAMTLSFTRTGDTVFGRVNAVSGKHVITFSR